MKTLLFAISALFCTLPLHAQNALHYYFPSIAVNCAADILLGFSGSSDNTFIGAYYAWRPAAGSGSEVPICIQAGKDHYNDDRWGDYSFTTLDPADSGTFWTVQEWAMEAGTRWGTVIAKVRLVR